MGPEQTGDDLRDTNAKHEAQWYGAQGKQLKAKTRKDEDVSEAMALRRYNPHQKLDQQQPQLVSHNARAIDTLQPGNR